MEAEIINSAKLTPFPQVYISRVPYSGAERIIVELVELHESVESLSGDNLKKRSLNDLQTIARSLKIHISGTKTNLIERIAAYFDIKDGQH